MAYLGRGDAGAEAAQAAAHGVWSTRIDDPRFFLKDLK
jgi:hypothetical protein